MLSYSLTGGINTDNTGGLINFFINEVLHKTYNETITIYISSTGGDLESAIRVYDFLKALPNKIHTVGFGQIDSAAITIFLAGDKRTLLKNSRIRFHPPFYNSFQISDELKIHEERLNLFKNIDKRIKEIAVNELGKKQSEVEQVYLDGSILTENEAKKFGLAHQIVDVFPKPENIPDADSVKTH